MLIKEHRTKRGLTQKELAAKSSISQGYLHKIENNMQIPSIPVIERIGNALEINPSKLIKFDIKYRKFKLKGTLK